MSNDSVKKDQNFAPPLNARACARIAQNRPLVNCGDNHDVYGSKLDNQDDNQDNNMVMQNTQVTTLEEKAGSATTTEPAETSRIAQNAPVVNCGRGLAVPPSLEDHRKRYLLARAVAHGQSVYEVAKEVGVDADVVADLVREELGSSLPPNVRKDIALARIDAMGDVLTKRGVDGDLDAINTWIKLQKRESALTGLDEPEKQERKVVVDVPWLRTGRLAYKDDAVVAEDIEAKKIGRD